MKINRFTLTLSTLMCLWLPGQALSWDQHQPVQNQRGQLANHHGYESLPANVRPTVAPQQLDRHHGHERGPSLPLTSQPPGYHHGSERGPSLPLTPQPPGYHHGSERFAPPGAIDQRSYESMVRNSQQSYEIAPGVTYYPAPRARYDYYGNRYIHHGGRIYDQCSIRDRQSVTRIGGLLVNHAGHEAAAATGAYVAGRIVGGNCR